jgi:hypothetical protein
MAPRAQLHLLYENPDTSHQFRTLPDLPSYYFHEAIRLIKKRPDGRCDAAFLRRLCRWLEWRDRKLGRVRDDITMLRVRTCDDCSMFDPHNEECAHGQFFVRQHEAPPATCPLRKGPVVHVLADEEETDGESDR